MLPASNQGVGENIGFPDVCNTPIGTGTSPITYPNTGSNATAVPFCPTIMLSCMPAHSQSSKPLLTNGDNAGVAHSSFMQSGGNNLGNARVLLQGMPAETLCNPTQGNNYNCSSNSKLVPSVTNVLMGYRPLGDDGWTGRLAEVHDRHDGGWGFSLDPDGRVVHVRRGRAAARAGLRPGDLLQPQPDPRQLRWTRGERRQACRLRPAPLPSAVALRPLADGRGRLVVRRISRAAPAQARAALATCRRRQASGVVLDLRGNPGGDVACAASLASLFLPGGVSLLEAWGPAEQRVSWRTADAAACWRGPLEVWVDAQTASAAEVLAAVLAAHERAQVFGGRSADALGAQLVDTRAGHPLGAWTLRHATGALLRPLA